MAQTFSTTLPQPNAPFFDTNGSISAVWVNWFLAIQNRTGGSSGIPASALQAQVNALFVEVAMADDTVDINLTLNTLQDKINSLFVEQAMISEPDPPKFPFFSMETVMSPHEPAAQANPFLAAFLIGDVS